MMWKYGKVRLSRLIILICVQIYMLNAADEYQLSPREEIHARLFNSTGPFDNSIRPSITNWADTPWGAKYKKNCKLYLSFFQAEKEDNAEPLFLPGDVLNIRLESS